MTAILRLAAALAFLLAAAPLAAQTVPNSREQVRLSFAPLVKQAAPAVVNIYTRRVVKAAASPLFADPFFRRFFGEVPGMQAERVQRSLGSGVIVGADGTVITNHHVIKDADEVTVVLNDRREFEAKLVGSDERSDIAVLKIDPHGEAFPALQMGDSDKLEVGDLVLAIGNPFGVGQTVTSGIVSALARTTAGISDYRSFIQTDAAINPGNSGGALIDLDGRLIGINTAIYSQGGGSVGIGFAIPTSLVRTVLKGLTSGGKVVRPWLGASGQAVTAELAQALGMPRPIGVLVNNLHRNGPAVAAGLKQGDVITAVNGREVDDLDGLRFRLATLVVGDEAKLSVMRDGTVRTLSIKLVPPPETPARDVTEVGGRNPFAGATIANLNPALAEELGLDTNAGGVIVTRIKRGTVANRLGIQPGDLILRINDRPVASVADAKSLLSRQAQRWAITVNRDGETMSLVIGG
jgi:serine protease Do